MTRVWDTHARSPILSRLRTTDYSHGPHADLAAFNIATGTPFEISIDGRTYVGRQSLSAVNYTTYSCYTNLGGCVARPGDQSKSETALRSFEILLPYADAYGDTVDTTIDGTAYGCYAHYPNTHATYKCYETYIITDAPALATAVRLPRDMANPPLHCGATVKAAAEADRTTGGIGSCAAGWYPDTPPGTLGYRDYTKSIQTCYMIYSRPDADTAWSAVDVPWDAWPNLTTYGLWELNQTRGEIWAKVAANQVDVWPIETKYSSATPTTITIPAGNIDSLLSWGNLTFIESTNGNIYYYNGTTYVGPVGAPLDTATWTWMEPTFGWLVVTDPDAVHFWRLLDSDGDIEFVQSIAGTWATVGCVSADHAVSGMWRRLSYDHGSGTWAYRGDMPHIQAKYDAGWSWSNYSIPNYIVVYKTTGGTVNYRYMRVA